MQYWLNVLNQVFIFSILAISLNLLVGYAGQISVAHAAFGAVGGYTAAYLSLHEATPFPLAVLIGVVLAAVVGAIVSGPALRLTSEYLILLTIAVSTIITSVVTSVSELGGAYGLLGIKESNFFGAVLKNPSDYVPLFLILTLVVYLVCRRIGESPYGRVLRGIRDDDIATRALGKNVLRFKVTVFALTAAMAGLAGGLLAFYNKLASPGEFGFDTSLSIFIMVILGGMGNLVGSILGAAAITLAQPLLEKALSLSPETASLWRLLVYGIFLVVLMRVRPQGLLPEGLSLTSLSARVRGGHRARRESGALPARQVPADAAATAPEKVLQGLDSVHLPKVARRAPDTTRSSGTDLVLEVHNLSKHFGGIRAVEDLDFELERGKVTALVGPNGAGKSTVFNLVTGGIRPDHGTVILNGTDITGLRPDKVARLGMVRSFQDVRVIPRLSVRNNVALAVQGQAGERLSSLFSRPGVTRRDERRVQETARQWLEFVGLADVADVPAGALAFGQQKLVAIARVLATDAEVLLMDEPASGIDGAWVDVTLSLIDRLRSAGHTICIVEHSLHVVERLADVTYFMELGRVTAKGKLQELLREERLAEAYFGTA